MSKLFKRIIAVVMSATMMTSGFSAAAFAAETISETQSISPDKVDHTFNFSVGDSETIIQPGFVINTNERLEITFSGAQGSGASVYFYKLNNGQLVNTLSIPPYVSGQPATLRTYFDFEQGGYYIAVKAYSSTTESTGSFTIYGMDYIFY
ncbi:MAG: hypothetical protein J1F28_09570 [Oscillospiraceae bacterium]|nr:hypothetical protein [Oscillospiraceae bacterium]